MSPGLVNAHTHIYSGLAPLGLPVPDPPPRGLPAILRDVWWRLDRALDEASLRAAARLYVAEALVAGTTVLVDHHESPDFIDGSLDVVADTCEQLGMRAVVCYGATERNGGRDEARRGLAECRRFIESNRRPLVRGAVGLHASFTVSDDTVREAGALCRELGAVLHLHVAEDAIDVTDARARGYEGPVERLLALEAFPPGSILAHGVHLSPSQVRQAGDHGAWLVQNPRSNRHNRSGTRTRWPRALRSRWAPTGLCRTWWPSSTRSTLRPTCTAIATPRCRCACPRERPWLPASFRISPTPISTRSRHSAAASGPRRRKERARHHLDVDRRRVVHDGRLLTADIDEIRREAREQADRLWKRMRSLP